MKKFLLLALMLVLVGCMSSVDKLNGSWKCDAQATLDANPTSNIQTLTATELSKKLLMAMLDSSNMSFDTEKKEVTLAFASMNKTVPLKIIAEDGDNIQVEIEGKTGTIVVVDDSTIHVKDVGNKDSLPVMVFKKSTK